MMRAASIALCLAIAGGPALADAASELKCTTLAKVQEKHGKDTTITPLSKAQFLFLSGVYVLNQDTPNGLPPGDSAVMLRKDKDKSADGMVLFVLGQLVCQTMAAPKKLLDYLAQIKSGAGADGDAL